MTYVFMTCKESLRIVSCWAASSLAVVSVGAATTLVVASGGGLAGGSGKALPVLLLEDWPCSAVLGCHSQGKTGFGAVVPCRVPVASAGAWPCKPWRSLSSCSSSWKLKVDP